MLRLYKRERIKRKKKKKNFKKKREEKKETRLSQRPKS